ncbi:MAG: hypothetical protein PSX71_10685 [bacterium]|nr:hypothetical protein [bacterium]
MKTMVKVFAALVLSIFAASVHAVPVSDAKGALFALSDGKGVVTLLWVPAPGAWPSAWQVSDETGRVLLPRIARGDAQAKAALAKLDEKSRASVQGFEAAMAKAATADAKLQGYLAAASRVLVDPDYAQAMGLAVTLAGVAAGAHRYTVTALDAAGATKLASAPVDAVKATPLPPTPQELSAKSVIEGAALSWQAPAVSRESPVYAHTIEEVHGSTSRIAADRMLSNTIRNAKRPDFIDRGAPREMQAEYRVYAIGIGGRRSLPAKVTLFVEDIAALVPPSGVHADAAAGVVTVAWPAATNPHTKGAVVERTQVVEGQWQALTMKAVNGTTYRDETAQAGGTYYYRVRFMGPRGDLGAGSAAVSARAVGTAAPAAVAGLAAEPGRTRITLHWNPSATPVAGYRVERALGGADWVAMAGALTREPRFDDDFPGGTDGVTVRYRVAAVAFDEQQGAFASVEATLPDILPPPVPRIMAAEAVPGKVTLTVSASGTRNTDRLLLLRAGDAVQQGLVLGEPRVLPATVDAAVVDDFATAGSTFWYRVVAVDAAGNRSEVSPAVMVRVPLAAIATAPVPKVRFDAQPLPHVTVSYPAPARNLRTVVQWRAGDASAPWYILAGPVTAAGDAVQVNVPHGVALAYRLVWVDAAANEGEPSAAATLPPLTP